MVRLREDISKGQTLKTQQTHTEMLESGEL